MPVLFGHCGSQLSISLIRPETIGKSIAVCVVSTIANIMSYHLIISYKEKGLTKKERFLFSLSCIPKATLTASFSGTILSLGKSKNIKSIIEIGEFSVSTALIMIAIMCPLGAILFDNLGPLLLDNDVKDISDSNKEVQISTTNHEADDFILRIAAKEGPTSRTDEPIKKHLKKGVAGKLNLY